MHTHRPSEGDTMQAHGLASSTVMVVISIGVSALPALILLGTCAKVPFAISATRNVFEVKETKHAGAVRPASWQKLLEHCHAQHTHCRFAVAATSSCFNSSRDQDQRSLSHAGWMDGRSWFEIIV